MSLKTFVRGLTFIAALIGAGAAAAGQLPAPTDKQIKAEAEQIIREHSEFGSQLTIQAKDGVVYVGGTPWTSFALADLESILRQTPGVTRVVMNAVYICA
jgi:hypothetical protein